MLATFYATIYLLIFQLDRTAFAFDGGKGFHLKSVTSIYFSIATITTTGYGDIHPISEWAMAAVSLEMLTGQFMNIVFFPWSRA
jgi:voltage-gated potassium channel Kch